MPFAVPLSSLGCGESGVVESVNIRGAMRRRMQDLGLVSGTSVSCVNRGHGISAYLIRGTVIALRHTDSSGITVNR